MKLSVEWAEASHDPAFGPALNCKFITTTLNCQLKIHRGQPAPVQVGSGCVGPGNVFARVASLWLCLAFQPTSEILAAEAISIRLDRKGSGWFTQACRFPVR